VGVSDLLVGLLSALMATNQPAAVSNLVLKKTGLSVNVPDRNDPVEKEYQKLLEDDDGAQVEVDQWIKQNQKFQDKGAGLEAAMLKARIQKRLEPVKQSYESFLKRHPDHARARLAYGSFLNDIGEEQDAETQWEKARELDPRNPAAWNNLANHYGHSGPVTKAFEYYAKAIEIEPTESLYYQNFATTVYLFRRDATNYFKISEQQVFDKALALYRKALELDSDNFLLATDFAQTYYGIKPPKSGDPETDRKAAQKLSDEALAAWGTALKLARDDVERQGVLIHFARIQINSRRFDEARKHLNGVTNEMFNTTKRLLTKKLADLENKGTNAVPGIRK
jgi:tetratricopeptide (TPR) repeat protein